MLTIQTICFITSKAAHQLRSIKDIKTYSIMDSGCQQKGNAFPQISDVLRLRVDWLVSVSSLLRLTEMNECYRKLWFGSFS